MKPYNSKSQAFLADFAISVLIFVIFFIFYFNYTKGVAEEKSGSVDDLVADAKTISSSLTSAGYPTNWNADNAVRIGLTDDGTAINNNKFDEFVKIKYNTSRKQLSTTNDYFLFFVNESEDVQNVEGICGFGNLQVKASFKLRSAYYYKDETKLKQFMIDKFKADIFCNDNGVCPDADIDNLFDNITKNKYDFVVIESPELPNSYIGDYKTKLEPWVQNGGIFMLSAKPVASQNKVLLGVEFNKKTGNSVSDRVSTVIRDDPFIAFHVGDKITFSQAYYIIDKSNAPNFFDIALFDADSNIALARWNYGSGKALFFSDFDSQLLNGNFQQQLEETTKKWVHPECLPIDLTDLRKDRMIRSDRMVIYNNYVMKMVLLVWN